MAISLCGVLDAPLLYSVQLAERSAGVERRRYGVSLEQWLRSLGELEALQSLATYSFEHPDDHFPELAGEGPCFEATRDWPSTDS